MQVQRVSEPHKQLECFRFIQQNVAGFTAAKAAKEEATVRRQVTHILPRTPDGLLAAAIVLRAVDSSGTTVGVAVAHPPYAEAVEVTARLGIEYAQGLLQSRRTLSGLAVREDARRTGVGRALVDAALTIAADEQALWMTGFMDERNGSPEFYESVGFTTMPRNTVVPRLTPFPLPEIHPSYVNGQWFYRPIGLSPTA
jgi:GNAT superfamily N-acetyltransferase